MLLSKEIIEKLAAQLLMRQVGSACEAVGVSLGSYYRWHWEARRLSRRRVPNVVDTPYETLLREFGRVTRKSRKRYLAHKQRARVKKTVSGKGSLSVRASRKQVRDLCKETVLLTSEDFDFKEKVV
ncbi:MAG: hypothetical protein OXN27_20855 [Candidatus Poribacteria bacterium]|nr:hypothetical protein [Candidatus Poribacteria bacterium]